MEYYPLVLGMLMKNGTNHGRRNSLYPAMEMLLDLLHNQINTVVSFENTCESLCEGLKMIDDENSKVAFAHRIFSDLMELPYLNEGTPYNINIKVVLIKTAQRILKEHYSSSVREIRLSSSSKRKAVGVMDRIMSSSKSVKLSREANHLKSELLGRAVD